MFRKLLTIFSLVGLVVSLGAWAASYAPVLYSVVGKGTQPYLFHVGLEYGSVRCAFWSHLRRPRRVFIVGEHSIQYELYQPWLPSWHWEKGFASLRFALWMPAVLFGTFLWLSYRPIRRSRKRRKLGLCVKCGYDLRGSSEKCPECGCATKPEKGGLPMT